MTVNFPDLVPYLLVIVKGLLIVVAVAFFVSGIDDFFIDLYYGIRSIYRRLFVMPKYRPLTEDQLLWPAEQAIAVIVPAWDEAEVIGRMLDNTLRTLNYANYHIFVGTYPNDPATQREVELVRERYDNLHRIVCPKDGPTNKADCLNWIYQGIKVFERENNIHFTIFVIEDSEDIVHPLSLKLFNYLIPRKDMVQLVVLPMECKWSHFTEGHYIDEFAEMHYKNLVAREFISRSLPSAGVGCAFSRQAIDLAASLAQNQLFDIRSLTEDYDIGLRLRPHGLKGIFVKQAIERVTSKQNWNGKWRQEKVKEYIVIRETFPKKFWDSVRQKSRWIVGICLQGWASLGWKGNLPVKYWLFRDRKTLITTHINMLGYFVVLAVIAYWLSTKFIPEAYHYPSLVERGTWLWYIILADTFFMMVRIVERSFCVYQFYNWRQALLSVPRFLWANVINFLACSRAIYLFARYLVTGKYIPWDVTKHVFPSEEELRAYRRKLGDMLLEKRFITLKQLDAALMRQKKDKRPLGAILVDMGLVHEEDLIQVLGMQLHLSTRDIDPYEFPLELLRVLPKELAVKYSVFPVGIHNGHLVVATNAPLSSQQVDELARALDRPIEVCLSTRSDVAFAIRRGYQRLEEAEEEAVRKSSLGQALLERQCITEEQLCQALKLQRRSYARLGDILLEEGMITAESLAEAVNQYSVEGHGLFGDFLVRNDYITMEQLQRALHLQQIRFRQLGEVVVEMEIITEDRLQQLLREKEFLT